MKKIFVSAVVALFLVATFAGSHAPAQERNYDTYLVDEHGNRILKLTVRYTGKEPVGEFEWHGQVNWRELELDFYTLKWFNLTGESIDFIREKSYTKSGQKRKEYRMLSDGAKEVVLVPNVSTRNYAEKPREQGNTLHPYEVQTDENMFYGISKGRGSNTAFFEVTFGYRGKQYPLKYYLIGTR
jgi:hypothetical protein